MDFLTGAFAAWLLERLADAGRRRLVTLFLGYEQERALRSAAATAISLTAEDFCPDGLVQAEGLAMAIDQVFELAVPAVPMAGDATLLEALQAGVEAQLAPLGDADLTGTGRSSAELLGLSAADVADKLTGHLVREIVSRGARGGPLTALANQVGHDVTHLKVQQVDNKLNQLARAVEDALAKHGPAASGRPTDGDPTGSEAPKLSEKNEKNNEYGTKFIEDELPIIVRRAAKQGVAPAVVFVDVDDLTVINKKFGRAVGDSVLDIIYEILRRRSLGKPKYKGRCGEDTFYSVLFDAGRVREYCEKIRADVKRYPWRLVTPKLYVSCTIGYASLSSGEDPYQWLARAITGMLDGKRKGGNTIQIGPQFSGILFKDEPTTPEPQPSTLFERKVVHSTEPPSPPGPPPVLSKADRNALSEKFSLRLFFS